MNECIFCKIAKGEIPAYKIWEDKNHIAFLDIYPQSEGMTIVIPKKHFDSYLINVEDASVASLCLAMKRVGDILDKRLENGPRISFVFEGLDVPHLHAKLIPLYKDREIDFQPKRADDKILEELLKKIGN